MKILYHPEKSLWIHLWQYFYNLPSYGKLVIIPAGFLLGYLGNVCLLIVFYLQIGCPKTRIPSHTP